jgi:hypothetical protein
MTMTLETARAILETRKPNEPECRSQSIKEVAANELRMARLRELEFHIRALKAMAQY